MGDREMLRVIHPNLKRGHMADRAAWLLLLGLLAILAGSVVHGIGMLAS
jgi:hypothetical protein